MRFHVLSRTLGGLLIAAFALAALPAHAGTVPAEETGWQFEITPYFWGAGVNGQMKLGDLPSGGVEANFSDLWKMLHFAAMGTFEMRKDRWGAAIDAVYIDLNDNKVPTPDPAYGDADVQMTQQLYTGLITYRVHEGDTSVDMGWGARYNRMNSDLSLPTGIAAGTTASSAVNWWDWLAAVHVVGHPSKNWMVAGYFDLGGGPSDFTWEAFVAAGYQFNKTISLKFGYRYLSIDYADKKFVYDVATAGPFVGVGFHF